MKKKKGIAIAVFVIATIAIFWFTILSMIGIINIKSIEKIYREYMIYSLGEYKTKCWGKKGATPLGLTTYYRECEYYYYDNKNQLQRIVLNNDEIFDWQLERIISKKLEKEISTFLNNSNEYQSIANKYNLKNSIYPIAYISKIDENKDFSNPYDGVKLKDLSIENVKDNNMIVDILLESIKLEDKSQIEQAKQEINQMLMSLVVTGKTKDLIFEIWFETPSIGYDGEEYYKITSYIVEYNGISYDWTKKINIKTE